MNNGSYKRNHIANRKSFCMNEFIFFLLVAVIIYSSCVLNKRAKSPTVGIPPYFPDK